MFSVCFRNVTFPKYPVEKYSFLIQQCDFNKAFTGFPLCIYYCVHGPSHHVQNRPIQSGHNRHTSALLLISTWTGCVCVKWCSGVICITIDGMWSLIWRCYIKDLSLVCCAVMYSQSQANRMI